MAYTVDNWGNEHSISVKFDVKALLDNTVTSLKNKKMMFSNIHKMVI